jgi:hypothetical protein
MIASQQSQSWTWDSHYGDYKELASCFYWFLAWLTLWPWRWMQHVPLKCQALSELHEIITQKNIVFNNIRFKFPPLILFLSLVFKWPALCQKCPRLLALMLILLHGNVWQHTAWIIQDLQQCCNWEIMDYPLYSPDMSPCDSDLFPKKDKDLSHKERLNMLQCYP